MENLADSYDGYRISTIDGMVESGKGDIYFGSPNSASLFKIDSTAGNLSILNDDLVRSNDLAADDYGSRLLVAESDPNRLVVFDLNHSKETILGWNLITFPDHSAAPISLDFIDQNSRFLAVLVNHGMNVLIFDLLTGKIRKRIQLADASTRIRCHQGWFYFQSEKGIYRKRIPGKFFIPN